MNDKNNPKNPENEPQKGEDNFDENEKFPNQKLNQIPKNLMPKKYTSSSNKENTSSPV